MSFFIVVDHGRRLPLSESGRAAPPLFFFCLRECDAGATEKSSCMLLLCRTHAAVFFFFDHDFFLRVVFLARVGRPPDGKANHPPTLRRPPPYPHTTRRPPLLPCSATTTTATRRPPRRHIVSYLGAGVWRAECGGSRRAPHKLREMSPLPVARSSRSLAEREREREREDNMKYYTMSSSVSSQVFKSGVEMTF